MTLALTIIPSLLILLIFVRSDRFREPTHLIIFAFSLGLLICFPAGFLNNILIWGRDQPESYTYLAALTEEPLKFLAIFFFLKNKAEFNEPMDALVYGTAVSLGFATLENFSYVYTFNTDISSFEIAALRALSAVPMHAACGVVMGYYFGRYVFGGSKKMLINSLAIPILLHALYNYSTTYSLGVAILVLIGMVFFCDRLHRTFLREQGSKVSETEEKNV